MGAKHVIFDDSVKLWEAESILTVAAHYSATIDLTTTRDLRRVPAIWIDWPGLAITATGTCTLSVLSGAATAPTTVVWTSRVYTVAESIAFFDTAENYILPLPMSDLLQFVRLNMAIGTAAVTAGLISGGLCYLG